MGKLTLMGQLRHIDGKKYISFKTESKEHVLPIIADWDAEEYAWVRFSGRLRTQSVKDDEGVFHKAYFGLGDLFPSESGLYANELTVNDGTVVRVDTMRTTPLTLRKIVDFVVADGDDYFNCITFGRAADMLASCKRKGSPITISQAMFHSREYTKEGTQRIAYEVCVRYFV